MVKGLTWLLHKVDRATLQGATWSKVGHGYSTRLDMVKGWTWLLYKVRHGRKFDMVEGSTWSKVGHGYYTRLDMTTGQG